MKKIIFPIIAIVIFLSTTAFKNDFFEIAKKLLGLTMQVIIQV